MPWPYRGARRAFGLAPGPAPSYPGRSPAEAPGWQRAEWSRGETPSSQARSTVVHGEPRPSRRGLAAPAAEDIWEPPGRGGGALREGLRGDLPLGELLPSVSLFTVCWPRWQQPGAETSLLCSP